MAVAQDRLHDLGRKEAEPQDAREPGASDIRFDGELRHRLTVIPHHHRMILVGLGEHSAQAVVRRFSRAATRAVDQESGLQAGALEPV